MQYLHRDSSSSGAGDGAVTATNQLQPERWRRHNDKSKQGGMGSHPVDRWNRSWSKSCERIESSEGLLFCAVDSISRMLHVLMLLLHLFVAGQDGAAGFPLAGWWQGRRTDNKYDEGYY
mmetsp:Transcript_31902/g.69057  ORF Transcript_31902/g.69057 Transcript_31902/m.69057 type:complete len:119 (-) Transcript_31902:176-532(-)